MSKRYESITLVEMFERWKFKWSKRGILEWRKERNARFLKKLTPFQQWLYLSKDMGGLDTRRNYFSSPQGNLALRKKIGENLDQMPDDWEELKKTIEYDEGAEILDFLKSLLGILSKSYGIN